MDEQNMEWMTQVPLAFLGVLHKMSRRAKKILTKYELGKIVKAQDHLNTFYLHL